MSLRDLLRSRLALRIYLVGLAQMAVVAIGFFTIMQIDRPTGGGPHFGQSRFVAAALERVLDDRRALDRELIRIRDDLRVSVTIIDDRDGSVVASTPPAPERRGGARRPWRPYRGERFDVPLRLPDGRPGHIEYVGPGRPPPPLRPSIVGLVLLVVGVSSWLLARSLTQPLHHMSRTARAFGGGNLRARVALARPDELGEVARAFDEMAVRVTELLRAEKELLANVSHELRTPLARIRVALDLAAEGDATVAREALAEITGDLEELERLISDVLAAARLDLGDGTSAGMVPLRRERVEAAELIAQAAGRFRSAHPDRRLVVETDPVLPTLDADPVLLRRVIDNLLENARKYSDAADAVELHATSSSELSIEVVDRGIGIAAADLPLLFRPFFRVDKSRTRATGGLGLGLALAKRIVDAHGGTITIESVVDEGTRVRVRLPVASGDGGAAAAQ
jgi:signal transduction histidine kinase